MGLLKNQFILSVLIFLLGAWAHQPTSRALQQDAIVAADDLVMYDRYELWRARYRRNYTDVAETQRRFEIFKDNVRRIEAFNSANGTSYKLGVNQFSDLTNEEFKARRFGFKALAHPARAMPFEYENVTRLPRTVDWRKSGAVTPVKDQGQCGSCWAFSSVAALEATVKINKGKLISLSEQELVDCNSANHGCHGGWMSTAFKFISKHGLTTEAVYPYTGHEGDCNKNKMSRPAVHTTGFGVVPSNDEKALLKAVAHQPVTVTIGATGFEFQHYKSGIFEGPCEKATNHAVTLIGYGTTRGGTKYWLLKNSWGKEWGVRGFMRIKREVADKQGLCGIALKPSYPKM